MSNDSERVNQVPVAPPDDIFKPFFTYGVFKKGQIAHSKIYPYISYVDDAEDVEIKECMLRIRDGLPVITDEKYEGKNTKGQIIHFCEGYEKRAYGIISDTEPEDLYEWGETTVNGIEVNVLYGININEGVYPYETDDGKYLDAYDGNNDLFFSDLLKFLKSEYKKMPCDYNDIFRLQMCYMILWSAIDRYCVLKYDSVNFQGDHIRAMSQDPVFIESIKECIKENKLSKHKPIHSARDARPWNWRESPFSILYFYYKLRGNVVHRGKDRMNNTGVLYQSLKELLGIFKKAINKTFSENNDFD